MRHVHCWLLVLVALVGAGCTPQATRAPSPPTTASGGAPRAAPSDPSPRAALSTSSPLVTWDTTPDSDIPLGLPDTTTDWGTLEIAATCVRLLLPNGQRVLLVWPDTTVWDAATQTITFVILDQTQARIELRHGDQIRPGGAPVPREPYREPYVAPYVAPTDPACPTDWTFGVNQVSVGPKQ